MIYDFDGAKLKTVADYAEKKHLGQLYGDRPYFEHVCDVVSTVWGITENSFHDFDERVTLISAAFLHDVIEDCDTTREDLIEDGFSIEVVDIVCILTKIPHEPVNNYLKRCAQNPISWVIKIADTVCNLEMSIKSNEPKRVNLYCNQLQKLYKYKNK